MSRTSAAVAGKTQQLSLNAAGQITSTTPPNSGPVNMTYTGTGYYDPAAGVRFGCQDKGWVDPGEDLCGEDEYDPTGRGPGGSQFSSLSVIASPRGLPKNNPNRFRRDWGSPRLCRDLHCTRPEEVIIGKYENTYWDPRRENSTPAPCGSLYPQHAFGLGQLLDCQREKYLGTRYMWTTDPLYQLYAMRQYIRDRYGPGLAGEWRAVWHEEHVGGY